MNDKPHQKLIEEFIAFLDLKENHQSDTHFYPFSYEKVLDGTMAVLANMNMVSQVIDEDSVLVKIAVDLPEKYNIDSKKIFVFIRKNDENGSNILVGAPVLHEENTHEIKKLIQDILETVERFLGKQHDE